MGGSPSGRGRSSRNRGTSEYRGCGTVEDRERGIALELPPMVNYSLRRVIRLEGGSHGSDHRVVAADQHRESAE